MEKEVLRYCNHISSGAHVEVCVCVGVCVGGMVICSDSVDYANMPFEGWNWRDVPEITGNDLKWLEITAHIFLL